MARKFSVEAVIKAIDKITVPVSKMQNSVGKFTRSAGRNVHKLNKTLGKMTGALVQGGKAAALAAGGAAASLATWITMQNAAATKSDTLAKSVGLQVETLEALQEVIRPAGFDFEKIIDMVEEMNNKLGESQGIEEITPVIESLEMLGLEFEKLVKLSPHEQFVAVANAALKMGDATQQSASAMDMLMGGDANKIIGMLRAQGSTVEELVGKHRQLAFRTDESREGALKFTASLNRVMTSIRSLSAEVAGLLGEQLAEWIEKGVAQLRALDRAVVAQKIKQFTQDVIDFAKYVRDNSAQILSWVTRFGRLLLVLGGLIVALNGLAAVLTVVNFLMTMNPIGLIIVGVAALIALIVTLVMHWEAFASVVKSTLARMGEGFDALIGGPLTTFAAAGKAIVKIWEGVFWLIDKAVSGAKSLFGDDVGATVTHEGAPDFSSVSSPQERTARMIEERNITNRSEFVLRNETGSSVSPARGGWPDNFQLIQSGGF